VPLSGAMPDPVGYFNAVWYDFSNWPGLGGYVNAGNLVLSGHVDCARCHNGGSGTAVFWSIRNMKIGDTAEYRTADGRTIRYTVTESKAVSKTANFEQMLASGVADMTVITCTGTFAGGGYDQRHIVYFKKV
jgi:LPXTG-site transpeptidase (sortase) family protein